MPFLRKLFFLQLLLLGPLLCLAQMPVANFTANVVDGCAPLLVQFTSTSANTQGNTTYNWSFGNGAGSALQNPSTTFLQPGPYTVSLTVTNSSGSNTKTVSGFITVKPAPTVSWTVNDSAGCPPHQAVFTNTTALNAPGSGSYLWSFGNGNTATQATTTQVFQNSGTYVASLRVTNSYGCIASVSKPGQIVVYAKPTAGFSAGNTSFCKLANNVVQFSGNASGGIAPYTYNWSFGDGSSSAIASPSHTYNGAGPFAVRLIVIDARGCRDTLLRNNYVTTTIPQAAFSTASTAGCVGIPLVFTDISNPASSSVFWNFGSAASPATSTSPIVSPVFNAAGTYSVMMVSTINGCNDTVRRNVQIQAGPVASFTNTPQIPCDTPATVSYVATAPAGSTYQWKFGNGGTATGATTTHLFTQYGLYTDTLLVTAASGCRSTVIRPVNVGIYNKQPDMKALPAKGCIPLTVQFENSIKTTTDPSPVPVILPYPSPVVAWHWDFRDGSTSTQAQPSHTFVDTGRFWVVVTMTTANGCVVKDSIIIEAGRPPTASFTYSPTTACVKQLISFTNTTTGAQTYEWSFGDGGSASGKTPVYQYLTPGSFVVILSAFHNGCVDTAMSAPITIRPPSAVFTPSYSCDTPLLVRFQNTSVGAQTQSWNFGDGSNDTAANVVHTYASPGIYNVRLVVSNSTAGCTDTLIQAVNLTPGNLSFTASDTAVCKGDTVTFFGNYTGDSVQKWEWYYSTPSGWALDTSRTAVMIRPYTTAGRWGVKLVIKDIRGCKDSVVKTNYILAAQPIARIAVSDSADCLPFAVTFSDSSRDVSGAFIVSRNWTFGNGQTLQTTSPTAGSTYTTQGLYDVTLIVTDNIGCTDTLRKPAFIRASKPIAGFAAVDTVVCPGSPVTFNNRSGGGLFLPSRWAFGDGDSSSLFSPTHTYQTPGVYSVWIAVSDSLGCTDTLIRNNYITVTRPLAAFTASDTQTVCQPPFAVTFTNNSQRATSFNWDYGNGTSSTLPNGGTSYLAPGIYTVLLTASDARGCKDTARQTIRVLGYAGALSYQPLIGCAPMAVTMTTNLRNIPSVVWDFGDGVTLADSGGSATHIYQTPGAYVPKLIVSNGQGCSASSRGADTIQVDVVKAGFSTGPACSGQLVSFTDTSRSLFSPVNAWQWNFPGSTVATGSQTNHILGISGNYPVQLIASNANGCKDTLVQTITVQNIPLINAGPDTAVCPGSSVPLSASGGISYRWSPTTGLSNPAIANPQASPQSPTMYVVSGTDGNGCTASDSVWVRLKTHTTGRATDDTAICIGTAVDLWAQGGTHYEWIPVAGLNDPSSATPTARPDTTTRYLVVIQDGRCVPDSHYVVVRVYFAPQISAGPDIGIVSGASVLLDAQITGAASINWSPAEGLSCTDCIKPRASPIRTTTYLVKAVSNEGCELQDSVTVFVDCKDAQLFVPNSFTPNGDGENDVFYVHGNGISQIRSLRIYNRWGGLVFSRQAFEVNDKSVGWDGSQGGEKLVPDVFVYVMEVECNTGQTLTYKGDVTLIR